jgi:hypothetical protein
MFITGELQGKSMSLKVKPQEFIKGFFPADDMFQ